MLFNSFEFVAFFVAVSALYFAVPHRARWALLLVASCAFYRTFIPVYILILAWTILIDWCAGRAIENAADPGRKRGWLIASCLSVGATLFAFKYFNFFAENVDAIAAALHVHYAAPVLRLALPIGLSFHAFQGLSYVIEVYRGDQKAERHLGYYALYVMYFPQLVAGPIERPQNLLHQFNIPQRWDGDRVESGLTLALWGLFKKVVVADSLAVYANAVYGTYEMQTGATLLLATYCFAFQIYCDFSGYSDIARGVSRVYGIELMANFDAPYLARSVSAFWARWHISLGTWFRDYLFVPLALRRGAATGARQLPAGRYSLAVLFVFLVSGLWHGARWTFVIWGGLHGAYLIAEQSVTAVMRRASGTIRHVWQSLGGLLGGVVTFHLVLLAWVFFRADSVGAALEIVRVISHSHGPPLWDPILVQGAFGVAAVMAADATLRTARGRAMREAALVRLIFGLSVLSGIALLGVENGAQFIYFQY